MIIIMFILSAVISYARPPYTLEEVAGYRNIKYIEMAKKMIATGKYNDDLNVALQRAAWNGNLEMVEILVDAGADVNAKFADRTIMHEVASRGNLETAKYLLSKGAPFDEKNASGKTPFFSATYNAEEETALWLLELGADPNVIPKNSKLSTPLFYAAAKWQPKLVKALINKGVNVNVTEDLESTPLHLVAGMGNVEIALLLINAGADVNAINEFGWTPLYCAVSASSLIFDVGDNAAVIDLLVKNGADITIADKSSLTPLDIAEKTMAEAVLINFKTEEAKILRIKRSKAALKRVKYHTKRSKILWKNKNHTPSASTKPAHVQEGSEAENDSVSTLNASDDGSNSNTPLKIGLLLAGLLAVAGIGAFIMRRKCRHK